MDARRLKSNRFSRVNDMAFVFQDPTFLKHTLVSAKSDVLAIICFKRYWGNNWIAFFLISEEMPPIYARELKRFVDDAIMDLGAERVQTDSVDCPELNRWHDFLNFELEGTRKRMLYGKDFNMWARVTWE